MRADLASDVAGFEEAVAEVDYSALGEPMSVTAPPERARMTSEEMDAEKGNAA